MKYFLCRQHNVQLCHQRVLERHLRRKGLSFLVPVCSFCLAPAAWGASAAPDFSRPGSLSVPSFAVHVGQQNPAAGSFLSISTLRQFYNKRPPVSHLSVNSFHWHPGVYISSKFHQCSITASSLHSVSHFRALSNKVWIGAFGNRGRLVLGLYLILRGSSCFLQLLFLYSLEFFLLLTR